MSARRRARAEMAVKSSDQLLPRRTKFTNRSCLFVSGVLQFIAEVVRFSRVDLLQCLSDLLRPSRLPRPLPLTWPCQFGSLLMARRNYSIPAFTFAGVFFSTW